MYIHVFIIGTVLPYYFKKHFKLTVYSMLMMLLYFFWRGEWKRVGGD